MTSKISLEVFRKIRKDCYQDINQPKDKVVYIFNSYASYPIG